MPLTAPVALAYVRFQRYQPLAPLKPQEQAAGRVLRSRFQRYQPLAPLKRLGRRLDGLGSQFVSSGINRWPH